MSRGDDGLEVKTDVDVLTDASAVTMDGKDLKSGIGGMIDDRIGKLIDGAPEELDTLKEIADELAENKSGVTTIIKKLGDKADRKDLEDYTKTKDLKTNLADFKDDESHRTVSDVEKDIWNSKVDRDGNKILSTNDFTDEYMNQIQQNAALGEEAITKADSAAAQVNNLGASFIEFVKNTVPKINNKADKSDLKSYKHCEILTQSQYDSLPSAAKRRDDIIFFIKK